MRRLGLFLAITAVLLAGGCADQPQPAQQSGIASDLRELGQPWPVLVGEFSGPLHVVEHTANGVVFKVGAENPTRYRLDYNQRRLTRLAQNPKPPAVSAWGRAKLAGAGDRRSLVLVWPDGNEITLSEAVPARGDGFAQSGDLAGVAFYEYTGAGVQLVYHDQAAGRRSIWRSLPAAPPQVGLAWSGNGRYLLEETGGKITVYDREHGFIIGLVDGTRPAFSPTNLHLTFWLPNGRPALLDLRTGFTRPILPRERDYRPLPTIVWSPDGSRLSLQAEAAAGANHAKAPFLLYIYSVEGGTYRRYPLTAPFDLGRYSLLFQATQPEVGRLLALIPTLKNGPLEALGAAGYLVGLDRKLCFLDLKARLIPLQSFEEGIKDLSLAAARRLLIVAGKERVRLYAWRLPDPALLGGAFPDIRDLNLGKLRLGVTKPEVRRLLGRPESVESVVDPFSGRDILETDRYEQAALTYAGERLAKAVYSAPGAPTGRGIEVGATLQDVYEAYGRPHYRHDDYLSYHGELDEAELKVAFSLGPDQRVSAILVARTEEKS
ncbi:MAG: hypothetical protein ACM3ZC_02045 [Bacteroidota bacterium]